MKLINNMTFFGIFLVFLFLVSCEKTERNNNANSIQGNTQKITYRYSLRDIPTTGVVLKSFQENKQKIEKKPNIFVFVVDTLRKDHITESIAPNMYSFASDPEVLSFSDNYSNSITTYFSATTLLFSILGHNRS